MSDLQYGKKIVSESYHGGILKGTKTQYSIPVPVYDKSGALNEVLKCLELITSKQTHKMTISVEADPRTHTFKLITRQYEVISPAE